jgi:hypothetical protein
MIGTLINRGAVTVVIISLTEVGVNSKDDCRDIMRVLMEATILVNCIRLKGFH